MTDDSTDPRRRVTADAADDCRVLDFGPHNVLQYGPHNTLRDGAAGSLYMMSADFALIGETPEESEELAALDEMRRQWPVVVKVPPPPDKD
jgi:hypothetical protein